MKEDDEIQVSRTTRVNSIENSDGWDVKSVARGR